MLSAPKHLGQANEILRFAQGDSGEFRMTLGGRFVSSRLMSSPSPSPRATMKAHPSSLHSPRPYGACGLRPRLMAQVVTLSTFVSLGVNSAKGLSRGAARCFAQHDMVVHLSLTWLQAA